MRPLTLALLAALAVSGAAHAADVKSCAAQWAAAKKAHAEGSQSKKQFMTTCQAAGAQGGAARPVSPDGEPAPH
jgi:hypothetical protein